MSAPNASSTADAALKSALLHWDASNKLTDEQSVAWRAITETFQHKDHVSEHDAAVIATITVPEPPHASRLARVAGVHSRATFKESTSLDAAQPFAPFPLMHALLHASLTSHTLDADTAAVTDAAAGIPLYDTALLSVLNGCSSLLSSLSSLHSHYLSVHDRSEAVRVECAAMVTEERRLLESAQRHSANLQFFTAADTLAQSLAGKASIDAHAITGMLDTIDTGVQYMRSHPAFHPTAAYLTKYERLKERVCRAIRQTTHDVLTQAQKQVTETESAYKPPPSTPSPTQPSPPTPSPHPSSPSAADGNSAADTSEARSNYWLCSFVIYRTFVPTLAPIFRDLERRATVESQTQRPMLTNTSTNRGESVASVGLYSATLREIHQIYFRHRHQFGHRELSVFITELRAKKSFTQMARAACRATQTILGLECQLFEQIATSSAADTDTVIHSLLQSLCSILYTALRPLIIQQHDIQALMDGILLLREELTESQPQSSLSSLSSVLTRLIGDCEERLVYRANTFIRDEIVGYRGTADDLDYPNKLTKKVSDSASGSDSGNGKDEKVDSESGGDSWHPVLTRTVVLLSQLARSVEPTVFQSLANSCVQSCLAQLSLASQAIERRAGPLHSNLFLLSHLLTFRAQLSPFALDLSSSTKVLDFNHMRDVIPNLFSSSRKFVSFGDLLSQAAPRVNEVRNDEKKGIEKQIKVSGERIIAIVTNDCIGSVLAVFAKLSAGNASGAGNSAEQTKRELLTVLKDVGDSDSDAPSLTRVERTLQSLHATVSLYLGQSLTSRSLLRPVHRSLVECADQLKFFASTHYGGVDATVEDLTVRAEVDRAIDAIQRAAGQIKD